MSRTFIRQDTQIYNTDAANYTDAMTIGSVMESAATNIEDDLNNLRTTVKDIKGETKWYTARGGRDLKTTASDLLDLEGKRLLFRAQLLTDITVPASGFAAGSITAVGGASLIDGEVFVLNDGINPAITFEFDDNGSVVPTPTLKAVVFTSGDSASTVATAMRAAINAVGATLNITASGAVAAVDLANDLAGAVGNTVITTTVAAGGFTITQFTGGAGDLKVLSVAGSEAPTEVAAVTGTAIGAVVKVLTTDVGRWCLDEVTGASAIQPKNLVIVRDATTDDPILSGGKQVYGLIQAETGVVDGDAFSDTTKQVQISFVREAVTGHTLEHVPVADIAGKVINYAYVLRINLDAVPEQAFLTGVFVDQSASVDVTLDNAVDNQSGPVTQNQNIDWRITDTYTLEWKDSTATKVLLGLVPNVAGDQLYAQVDDFNITNVNEATFSNGVAFDSGGTAIHVGNTAGTINSAGKLDLVSTATFDLKLAAGAQLVFNDQWQAGSTYATDLVLGDSSAEWSAFETKFGEVSLLNAIVAAANSNSHLKTVGVVTGGVHVAGTNITSPTNLDAALGDWTGKSFVTDIDVFLNGVLLRGAATAIHDVYPGTTSTSGDVKFTFKVKTGDVLTMSIY